MHLRAGDSGPFTAVEHVYPESLGNPDVVLPPGIVCDPCNHGHLSARDQWLITFEPIAMLRVMFLDLTKQGKPPRANFQNLSLERRHDGIRLSPDRTGEVRNLTDIGNGLVRFRIEGRGRRFQPRDLGRSLFKVGLGFVAFKEGPAVALLDRYDEARRFILQGGAFPNDFLMQRRCRPQPLVKTSYTYQYGGTVFILNVFGVRMLFNLEREPRVQPSDVASSGGFERYSLA